MQNVNTITFATILLSTLAILLILIWIMIYSKRKSVKKPLKKKESKSTSYKQASDELGTNEIPDDPDEAMAWLEKMAKDQEAKKK